MIAYNRINHHFLLYYFRAIISLPRLSARIFLFFSDNPCLNNLKRPKKSRRGIIDGMREHTKPSEHLGTSLLRPWINWLCLIGSAQEQ